MEDEFLIALELATILERGGFGVIGPVTSVAAALKILAGENPDAAVLDVNLKGEKVTPVAWALQAKGVPFVLASAFDPTAEEDRTLAEAFNVGKPTEAEELLQALQSILD